MKLIEFTSGPVATNAFLLINQNTKEAVLIDAPANVFEQVQHKLREHDAKLLAIFLTHGHWDHIADVSSVCKDEAVKVYAHVGDCHWLEHPELMAITMPKGLNIEPVKIDQWLKDDQQLEFLDQTICVLHVPGHAPGNVAYYFPQLHKVFTGDSLFCGTIGRTDLPGSDFDVLKTSIHTKLFTLPKDTIIYAGHGPISTIEQEKANNPYVGLKQR